MGGHVPNDKPADERSRYSNAPQPFRFMGRLIFLYRGLGVTPPAANYRHGARWIGGHSAVGDYIGTEVTSAENGKALGVTFRHWSV